jgi:hypothetical protein
MRTLRAITSLAALAALAAASCRGGPGPVSPTAGGYDDRSAVPRAPNDDGALGASPRVSFALAQEPPVGLTASDGTGLKLVKLDAQAVVDGPLAFTEMHLAFENPEDRVLEGTFRITLPHGASLGRFAMKINGEWQEGEVVELQAARRAYEDFLHRKQDPALMEKSAGNEFSARVFPIPARGLKEIVVAYAHEVHDKPYVLPLKGLPELGALDVKVHVVGAKADPRPLSSRGLAPAFDYVADVRTAEGDAVAKQQVSGIRNGELAILRVKPQSDTRPEPLDRVLVLVDTSASRVLGFDEEVKTVERIVKKVAEANGSVVVAAFDQSVAPIDEGRAAQLGDRDLARLRDRGALGASDIERALVWAKDRAKAAHAKRVVLVTDGVATAGATEPKKLGDRVSSLRDAGVERLDAVAVGGIRDDAGLTQLVRGHLAHDGVVATTEGDGSTMLRRLGEATRSGIAVKVDGATWAWPQKLDGVQAGETYTVYAEVPAAQPVRIAIDGSAAHVVDLRKTERPLVERAVAQAKIDSMIEREATTKDPADLKKSITALAVQHRIVTPYTAMLVLETEADYARFHIDRRSLADVLAIDAGNVKRLHRTFRAPPSAPIDVDGDERDPSFAGKDKAPATKKSAVAQGPSAPAANAPRQPGAPPPAPKPAEAKPAKEEAKADAKGGSVATGSSAPGGAPAARPAPTTAARPAMEPPPPAAAPPPPPTMQEARAEGRRRPPADAPARETQRRATDDEADRDSDGVLDATDRDDRERDRKPAYEGRFATVMEALRRGQADEALSNARAWRAEAPGDVLALVAIGEAAEAKGLTELASRAYGSVIDLFPNRADLRRFVGERLDRVAQKDANALDLAIDTYAKAAADRPDHPASHRLLAYALLKKKQYAKAFDAIEAGRKRSYEPGRFAGVEQILAEDVGLVGAAWAAADPSKRDEVVLRTAAVGGTMEDKPSIRFVLNWETDANDVDFHIHDAKRNHAFFGHKHLKSGGDLYADVTTGYGPECFTIRLPKERRVAPYRLEAHYYSRGPMGYGMGKLEVIEHDGKGNLRFEERPFIVMVDQAYVDLGTVQ